MVSLSKKRIANVFNEAVAVVRSGNKPNLFQIQKNHGYKDTSARAYRVVKTRTWQELMESVSDEAIIAGITATARDRRDKRAHLQASDMLLRLKDRYPAGKLKVQAYNEEIERLKESPILEGVEVKVEEGA